MKRGPSRDLDRREFVAVSGAAVLSMAAGCGDEGSPSRRPPLGPVVVGMASDFAVDTTTRIDNPARPLLVLRDADGLYAMTAVCTHQACVVAATLTCPCHGSRYDRTGEVVQGPAERPLEHYAVEVGIDGSVTVDPTQVVPSSTRATA